RISPALAALCGGAEPGRQIAKRAGGEVGLPFWQSGQSLSAYVHSRQGLVVRFAPLHKRASWHLKCTVLPTARSTEHMSMRPAKLPESSPGRGQTRSAVYANLADVARRTVVVVLITILLLALAY